MYKSQYIRVFLLVVLPLCLMLSCQKQGEGVGEAMSFAAKETAFKSTGVVKTNNTNLVNKPFGLAGVFTDSDGAEGGTNAFNTESIQVRHNGSSWEYDPLAYWRINKYYRFRAYHPYDDAGGAITVTNIDADNLRIEYRIANGEEDLLVGFWAGHATSSIITNRVQIPFRHALSGLAFRIAFKNVPEIADSYTDNITQLYVTGIESASTLLYSHEDGDPLTEKLEWVVGYYDESDFYNWSGSKEFRKYDNTSDATKLSSSTEIFDHDGLVFAIPQTCSSTAAKPTMVHFKTEKGADALHSATLPQTTWEPGKIYTYTLLINKSDVEVLVSIKDWTEVESNEDIYV